MSSLPRASRSRKATAGQAPPAAAWSAWTDAHRWEPTDRVIGTDSMGADVYESDCAAEPDALEGEAGWIQVMIEASLPPARIPGIEPEPEPEPDAEFLARLGREEAAERDRIADTYRPTASDLAEYDAYLASIDDGPEPYFVESFHTIDEWDAIRRGQVSEDELAMLASYGCI